MDLNRRIRAIDENGKPILVALYELVPTGTVIDRPSTITPTGYLPCDGASYLRSDYPDLYAVIGAAHGSADGTHFNVPDRRGRFPRGQDQGTGRDPDAAGRTAMNAGGNTGDNVGSIEADAMQGHVHGMRGTSGSGGTAYPQVTPASATNNFNPTASDHITIPQSDGSHGTPRTASETRPINANTRFYIKT